MSLNAAYAGSQGFGTKLIAESYEGLLINNLRMTRDGGGQEKWLLYYLKNEMIV